MPKMSKLDKGANILKRNKVHGPNEQIEQKGPKLSNRTKGAKITKMNIVPKMDKLDKGANITKRDRVHGPNEQNELRSQNEQLKKTIKRYTESKIMKMKRGQTDENKQRRQNDRNNIGVGSNMTKMKKGG